MLDRIPLPVRQSVLHSLRETTGPGIKLQSFSFSGGGCINHGGKLSTNAGDYFLKWNSTRKFPGMFAAEARGLNLLADRAILHIPKPVSVHEDEAHQFILMEYIEESGKSRDYWTTLGEQLAALHRHSDAKFGLNHDNYIGSLPQHNRQQNSWIDFFVEHRLEVQLKLLERRGSLSRSLRKQFDTLYTKLKDLVVEEQPALLHGDLWSSNLIGDAAGNPCVIDPAVYYGHREIELAFTTLFGGFSDQFYDAYQANFPLAPGFEDRFHLYNLYPLLVHANLFGGSYLAQASSIVSRYA